MSATACRNADAVWSMCSGGDSWWHGQCQATCSKCVNGRSPCAVLDPEPEPGHGACDEECTDVKSTEECAAANRSWGMCTGHDHWWHQQCKWTCRKCAGGLPPCTLAGSALPSLLVPLPTSAASAAEVDDAFASSTVWAALGASIAEGLRSSGIPSLADDDVEVVSVNVIQLRRRTAALSEGPGGRHMASSAMALEVEFQIRATSAAASGTNATALEAGIDSLGKSNSTGAQGFAAALGPNLKTAAADESINQFASLLEEVGEEWTTEPPVPTVQKPPDGMVMIIIVKVEVEQTTDEPSRSQDGANEFDMIMRVLMMALIVGLCLGFCCVMNTVLHILRTRSSDRVLPFVQPTVCVVTSVKGLPCGVTPNVHVEVQGVPVDTTKVEPEQLEEGTVSFVKPTAIRMVGLRPSTRAL